MQDKDFDKLFKDRFADFDEQPSAQSWLNIEKQLHRKPKNKLPFLWMAAASVLVVLGIGFLLYRQPTEVIQLKKKTELAKINNPVKKTEIVAVDNSLPTIDKERFTSSDSTPIESSNKTEKNLVTDATIASGHSVLDVKKIENMQTRFNTQSASAKRKVTESNRKINNEKLQKENASESLEEQITLAQTDNIKQDKTADGTTDELPRKKIKSVGDLVNMVIAKVDNRKEKLFKLSKTEESDNEITEINLGLFKYKKAD